MRVKIVLWVAAACLVAAVSAAAVWARVAQYPMWLPRPLPALLEWFVEPGVLVWWLTRGAVFQSFPRDFAGYALTVAGNTVVWMTLAGFVVWGTRRIRRALGRARGARSSLEP